jgi:hypothetical protein
MKDKIIGVLNARTKRAQILDGEYYVQVLEEDDFDRIAEQIIANNELMLIDFFIYLQYKGLINDYDFDYEKEVKRFIK